MQVGRSVNGVAATMFLPIAKNETALAIFIVRSAWRDSCHGVETMQGPTHGAALICVVYHKTAKNPLAERLKGD